MFWWKKAFISSTVISFVHRSMRSVFFSFSSHSESRMALLLLLSPLSSASQSIRSGTWFASRWTVNLISEVFI